MSCDSLVPQVIMSCAALNWFICYVLNGFSSCVIGLLFIAFRCVLSH